MIIFNTNSWHYKLVTYVFGKAFFFRQTIDSAKLRNKLEIIEDKARKEYPNDDKAIEKAFTNFRPNYEDLLIYTTPQNINFCPYCRAVLFSVVLFPACVLSKLIPTRKKKNKPFDIKKSRRNVKIIKIVAMAIMSVFGVHSLYIGNYGLAAFHFGIASFQIWGKYVFDWYAKLYEKRMEKKLKEQKPILKKQKNPGLFTAYIKSNHDKVCPQVTFVDKNDTEVRV